MTEYKEVVSNWIKFTKVNDFLAGTLIGSELKEGTDPQGRPQKQMVYEILADEGGFHTTIEDANGNKVPDEANPIIVEKGEYYNVAKGSIDAAMKKIKNGQKVKFEFTEIIPSKDKMKNAFKLVKVYAGPMDTEYLNTQWGEPVGEAPVDTVAQPTQNDEEPPTPVENVVG